MITIYSTLKPHTPKDPWHDRFEIIQTNAINSWKQLKDVEIIIFGNNNQTKDFCKKHDVIYSGVSTTWKTNAPYLNDMVKRVETLSSNNMFLYVSDDIIIFEDTIKAAKNISNSSLSEFCGCSQRYDAPIRQLLDFNSNWIAECQKDKVLGHPSAGDYFIYSRGYWRDQIPPLAVGYLYCDDWLRWYASDVKKSLINMTERVLIIHPEHNHSYIKGDCDRVKKWRENIKSSQDFKNNKKLASRYANGINVYNYNILEFSNTFS
jgi:hypothetical protein